MRINSLLNHVCDIQTKGTTVIGRDKYNKPIYSSNTIVQNVPCRIETEIAETTDEQGDNYVEVVRMVFPSDVEINKSVQVMQVRDKQGTIIKDRPLEVDLLAPVYGRFGRLHHYEATMKEV